MNKRFRILAWAVIAAGMVSSSSAWAAIDDALIEGAKLCTRHLPRYEREYGIPTHLLSAIASTESGRYHEGLGIKVPWPWTINAQGKGYFFATKDEAIAAARHLRSQGIESMDVGCMQVNIHHHPNAFASLDEAFEPEHNIAYAASFLRGLYQDGGSWKRAAADYHSKTPTLGNQYVGLVYNSWYEIIEKLRTARLTVPESSVVAMNAMKTEPIVQAASEPPPATHKKIYKIAHALHTRSIEDRGRDNAILVIRPEDRVASSAPMTVAQARTDAPEAKIIDVSSAVAAQAPDDGRKSGPRFIFSD